MMKSFTAWHWLIVVFLLPFVAYGAMKWYEKKFTRLPVYGLEAKDDTNLIHRVGDFELINQDGLKVSRENWKGKIVVVDFFFTHCPNVCPKMTASLVKVRQAYNNDDNVLINSFSVDPQNDRVPQLKKYADRFNIKAANWSLLTGDKKEIYKLARNGFMVVAADGDGGAEDFIHSEKLVLVDSQQQVRGYYNGTDQLEVDQLINDIKKLQHE